MKYESKFSIGQEVWAVRNEPFSRIVKCITCNNTGNVTIGTEDFICPKCSGRAGHSSYGGRKFYVYERSCVGKVIIQDEPTRYNKEEPNPEYTYMIDSTGIGSGQIWSEECLFPSRKEAQAFCDGKNGVLPADEVELLPDPIDQCTGKVVRK